VGAHIPQSEVGRVLGHTQANTTYRYVNANVEMAKRAAAELDACNAEPRTPRLLRSWCTESEAMLNFDSTMQSNKAYDEVIEFIASSSPQNVIAFRPSEEAKARVADLIFREKTEGLPEDEKSELDHYLQIEHLMRLAKARAHHYLANG